MPLKVSIGLSRKIGQPDYGSLGASCHVEFELCNSHLTDDPEKFQRQVRSAYAACQQAVDEQLAAQQADAGGRIRDGRTEPANGHAGNGSRLRKGGGNGQSRYASHPSRRMATQSQSRAIRAIAGRQQLDLPGLLEERFGVSRPDDLALADASALIDELNGLARATGVRR